jgi:hypothetical protein
MCAMAVSYYQYVMNDGAKIGKISLSSKENKEYFSYLVTVC